MTTSVYLSWAKKRESKVPRSAAAFPASEDANSVQQEPQETDAYSTWLRRQERKLPLLGADDDDAWTGAAEAEEGDRFDRQHGNSATGIASGMAGVKDSDSSSRSAKKAGKRPRSWPRSPKGNEAVGVADEYVYKRLRRSGGGDEGAKVSGSDSTSNTRLTMTSLLKRNLVGSAGGDVPSKKRRISGEIDADRDDCTEACEHATIATVSGKNATQLKRSKSKRTVALLDEAQYWMAVDRFSHLA
ncbi:hypothetical protein BBJ28_00015023 [Nothophytophthora sp. Chile5]|nr:hypothetical protein BBJ28_00015023 [Nothophytophthora sp. Chile5]